MEVKMSMIPGGKKGKLAKITSSSDRTFPLGMYFLRLRQAKVFEKLQQMSKEVLVKSTLKKATKYPLIRPYLQLKLLPKRGRLQ